MFNRTTGFLNVWNKLKSTIMVSSLKSVPASILEYGKIAFKNIEPSKDHILKHVRSSTTTPHLPCDSSSWTISLVLLFEVSFSLLGRTCGGKAYV
jgi:hypothetical protein